VAESGEQIIVEDMKNHPIFDGVPLDWTGSIIGLPLKFSNSIVGVMNLSRTITGQFTNAEKRLLGLLADQAAIAIFNANRHEELAQRANTDSMTGLPNRRALEERLQGELNHASRTKAQFVVVMMDWMASKPSMIRMDTRSVTRYCGMYSAIWRNRHAPLIFWHVMAAMN
jgi:GAF domain-containing protein